MANRGASRLSAGGRQLIDSNMAAITPTPQTLTYTLGPGSPAGSKVDPATGVFTWTPGEGSGGQEYPVVVLVSDGKATVQTSFVIKVARKNAAPIVESVPPQFVEEGSTLTVPIKATDADIPNTMPSPFRPAPTPTPGSGTTYYADLTLAGSGGAGTLGDPWRYNDLFTEAGLSGPANAIPVAGDTVLFSACDLTINTSSVAGNYELSCLCPTNSGDSANPITYKPRPGAFCRLTRSASGVAHIFGTRKTGGIKSYVKFEGFELRNDGFNIIGVGHEVAYCRVVGQYKATRDNWNGARSDSGTNNHFHHSVFSGFAGAGWEAGNSCGIEAYGNEGLIVEDCLFEGTVCGLFDKASGIGTVFRRNLANVGAYPYMGNLNGVASSVTIEDNYLAGVAYVNNYGRVDSYTLAHNLILCGWMYVGTSDHNPKRAQVQGTIHSNIVISPTTAMKTLHLFTTPWAAVGGGSAPLLESDYNIFLADTLATPTIGAEFGTYLSGASNPTGSVTSFANLTALRAAGMEANSQALSGGRSTIFDAGTWDLKPAYATAGKSSSTPGPTVLATVLDRSRYGPDAAGYTTPAATALTITGAASMPSGHTRSPMFVVAPNGKFSGTATATITPASGSPTTVELTWDDEGHAKGFYITLTPGTTSCTIAITNDGGLSNPATHQFN